MSSNLFELKPATNIPGFPIIIPRGDVKEFLLSQKHISVISEPKEFIRGLIIEVNVYGGSILMLLKNDEALKSCKIALKPETMTWYQLR
ncbi:MAG: hypothetical protein PHS49_03780 [Candidatus Gracilibacteria bacterium]|nr:hypothetical protein [Candidatus Gracilibacteria bacterium]